MKIITGLLLAGYLILLAPGCAPTRDGWEATVMVALGEGHDAPAPTR